MNKLAQYLNQHISGEVVTEPDVLDAFSRDKGPLKYRPQMIAYPSNVSDIRKLMRFTWQLAEKGHTLPVTVRGAGGGISGAASGDGIVLVTERDLTTIAEYDGKQRLVRLQPGASVASIQNTLGLQAAWLPDLLDEAPSATIGGFVGDRQDALSLVKELEVILPNGDVLQTKRLSKREFGKKKGEQTFEGSIYRAIDTLIEEQSEMIESIDENDRAGYASLAQVRGKDGSFDLTPLIVGSQGSLGIISEMIVFSEYLASQQTVLVLTFSKFDDARDALDQIAKLNPERIDFVDKQTIARAAENGKQFASSPDDQLPEVAFIIALADGSARAQVKKQKKIVKLAGQFNGSVEPEFITKSNERAPVWSLVSAGLRASKHDNRVVTLASGLYAPLERFDEMTQLIGELSSKHKVAIFVGGQPLKNRWRVHAELHFTTTAGRQLLLTLIDEIHAIAQKLGGTLISAEGEGRLVGPLLDKTRPDEVKALDEKIKATFDPHDILNPGVKQFVKLQEIAKRIS